MLCIVQFCSKAVLIAPSNIRNIAILTLKSGQWASNAMWKHDLELTVDMGRIKSAFIFLYLGVT